MIINENNTNPQTILTFFEEKINSPFFDKTYLLVYKDIIEFIKSILSSVGEIRSLDHLDSIFYYKENNIDRISEILFEIGINKTLRDLTKDDVIQITKMMEDTYNISTVKFLALNAIESVRYSSKLNLWYILSTAYSKLT